VKVLVVEDKMNKIKSSIFI